MRVLVNGEARVLAGTATVAELLDRLGLRGRLAVELNHRLLPRSRWPEQPLAEGDRIEVVRAIGGG